MKHNSNISHIITTQHNDNLVRAKFKLDIQGTNWACSVNFEPLIDIEI